MNFRIAIDAMGGDFAPREVVKGAVQAIQEIDDQKIVLVGIKKKIEKQLSKYTYSKDRIRIVATEEVVDMAESPTCVLKSKANASLPVTARLVAEGEADAMISAGNTGATMVAARKHFGPIQNVERPAIATLIPSLEGKTVLLDAGANVDCKPRHLVDFAFMGEQYASRIMGITSPRVGLLSVGTEKSKGNDSVKKAFSILEKTGINFIGNVEGRNINDGSVDVVVCDGFVGNILIKFGEGLVTFLRDKAKSNLKKHWWRLPAAFGIRKTYLEIKKECDYAEEGGAPLLGLNGICIISHGGSSARAIRNAIGTCRKMIDQKFVEKFHSWEGVEEKKQGEKGS